MAKVPVIGKPSRWAWFPSAPLHHLGPMDKTATILGTQLWRRHFATTRQAPVVRWSRHMGKTGIQARTYHWGIVLSSRQYLRVRTGQRGPYLVKLLLHELLHWAGYGHDRRFREAAKRLGTW